MLMKSKGLGTVASQWSNDKEMLLNWQPPMFFCGEWGEKGKKDISVAFFFFLVRHVQSTQDRAGRKFFWIPTKPTAQRSRNSVKRSWMPEEAILSDQMEKLCLSTLKTKLQVRNDWWRDVFNEQIATDMREKIQLETLAKLKEPKNQLMMVSVVKYTFYFLTVTPPCYSKLNAAKAAY